MYDILIIGAGPAGLTAALYARRAEKSVLLLEKETFGGQITYSPKVENFPTVMQLSGNELAEKMLDQVLAHGAEVALGQATAIRRENDCFGVLTEDGEYLARSVILATGSHHRLLGIDREEEFIGNGISFCAVCDGAFYTGRDVAVVGGGDTALQDALFLANSCRSVTLIHRRDQFRGEDRLVRQVESRENIHILYSHTVEALHEANGELTGVTVKDVKTGATRELAVEGLFAAVGQLPQSAPFAALVNTDGGDGRVKSVRQLTTAVGDGAVAGLAACRYVDALR